MDTTSRLDPRPVLGHLQGQRRHVLGILDGLDEEQLRRGVLPSGWSCLGLVRHLTLDDEQFWFQAVLAGDPAAIAAATSGGPADAWVVPDDVPATAVLDAYREQAERSDAVVSGLTLDAGLAWWPDFFGEWRLRDLQDLLLHVITETSVHAGQLDAVRELLDGRQWIVLD
jgi:uncharacterized damage-inducible protein DinB